MQSKTTAKDFFIYLGVIVGLYASAVSFLVLVFQIINKLFPLAGDYYMNIDEPIRISIAVLIIFFPVFIYLAMLKKKDLEANPDKKEYWMRKWSIFLTLFIAGVTIAIDLVTLVYKFLGAEDLTTRFFIKVFFVLAVTVTIFRYSLTDLRRENFGYDPKMRTGLYVVSLVVLAGIVYGVVIIGSPTSQRAKMMDTQRVTDLINIQNEIVYIQWENKGVVPETLEDLKNSVSSFTIPSDPETKQNYEYKMLSKNSFELCATFKTIVSTSTDAVTRPAIYPYANENWHHGAERTCFTRTIDPTLYKIKTQPIL